MDKIQTAVFKGLVVWEIKHILYFSNTTTRCKHLKNTDDNTAGKVWYGAILYDSRKRWWEKDKSFNRSSHKAERVKWLREFLPNVMKSKWQYLPIFKFKHHQHLKIVCFQVINYELLLPCVTFDFHKNNRHLNAYRATSVGSLKFL